MRGFCYSRGMKIQIYAMDAGGRDFTEEPYARYLSGARRREAEQRKKESARQLYLAAEVLLNRSLELEGCGIALPAAYTRNPYGKPCLAPEAGICVNWSHSGTWAVCALSDREVGIDLQETGKEPGDALVRRTLQPEELDFYRQAPEERRKRLFYEYWTVKESFLKAVGTGFHMPLDAFYIRMENGVPETVQRAGGRTYTCRLLDFADRDYAAAFCVEGDADPGAVRIKYL